MVSAYAGLALVVVAVVEYLVRLRTGRAPFSTRAHDVAVATGAAIAAAWVALGAHTVWPAFVASGIAVVWFMATRRLLFVPRMPMAIELGDALPPFTVTTSAGASFSHADLVAAAPAVLVVYRGKW